MTDASPAMSTDAAVVVAAADEAPAATDTPGAETAPPITKLKSFEDILAEKRARQTAEDATGSGKTIVQPPDEVKARLAERQKKQRERAEAARAEASRAEASRAETARRRSDEKEQDPTLRSITSGVPVKTTAKTSADAEKKRAVASQETRTNRPEGEVRNALSASSTKPSAVDANARFVAAAAARAAAAKANTADASASFPPFSSRRNSGEAVRSAQTLPAIASFDEIMAEKKRKERSGTNADASAAEDDEKTLVTKTIAVKTPDDQTLEITMKVRVPRERLAELEAKRAAKEASKRQRDDAEATAGKVRRGSEADGDDGEKTDPDPGPAADTPQVRTEPVTLGETGGVEGESDAREAVTDEPPKRARRTTTNT